MPLKMASCRPVTVVSSFGFLESFFFLYSATLCCIYRERNNNNNNNNQKCYACSRQREWLADRLCRCFLLRSVVLS